jgi:hypothetical protein
VVGPDVLQGEERARAFECVLLLCQSAGRTGVVERVGARRARQREGREPEDEQAEEDGAGAYEARIGRARAPEDPSVGSAAMPAVVMFADTVRSPELRHEVPLPIGDPLVYVETNGSRYAFAGSLELPRLAEIEGLHSHGLEDIGWDELVAAGMTWHEAHPELVLRACRRVGVESAVVPRSRSGTTCARTASRCVPTVDSSTGADARRTTRRSPGSGGRRRDACGRWSSSVSASGPAGA